MLKRALFVSLLGFLLSAEFALAQQGSSTKPATPPAQNNTPLATKDAPDVWQPVANKEGNFSIIFPVNAKNEATRSRIQMQDGNGIETRFTAPTASGTYQAAFTFLSDNIATPQSVRQRFDALLKNLKANPKIKWLSGGEIEYKGNPGIELKVMVLENKTITWSRQYFAFGCIYETTARYTASEPEIKEPKIFLDSFTLLGPPTQRPTIAVTKQDSLPDFTPLTQTIYYVSPETLRKQAIQPVEPDFSKKAPFWEIKLRVTVSPEGKVVQADPVDAYSPIYDDAIKAAKKWSFKPFLHAGKPVSVQGQLVFKSAGGGSASPK